MIIKKPARIRIELATVDESELKIFCQVSLAGFVVPHPRMPKPSQTVTSFTDLITASKLFMHIV
jgi:hypothetical protein